MFCPGSNMKNLLVAMTLINGICGSAAHAQGSAAKETSREVKTGVRFVPTPIHEINVAITCGNVPDQDVVVVTNNRDDRETGLVGTGNNRTGSDFRINFRSAQASIRFGARRTDCRKAEADRGDGVARFDFPVCRAAVRSVTIVTSPPIRFSYVRELVGGQQDSVACKAGAAFSESGEIKSVQLPGEKVLLRLGPLTAYPSEKDADSERLALRLFSSDYGAPGVFTFSDKSGLLINDVALKRHAAATPGGDSVQIDSDDIVRSLIKKHEDSPRPLNPAELAILHEAFGNLKTVELKVLRQ